VTDGLTCPPEKGALIMIPASKLIATKVSPRYDLLALDTAKERIAVAMTSNTKMSLVFVNYFPIN
jgi:hypothetical protein